MLKKGQFVGYFEIKRLSIELGRSTFVDELELTPYSTIFMFIRKNRKRLITTFPERASHLNMHSRQSRDAILFYLTSS